MLEIPEATERQFPMTIFAALTCIWENINVFVQFQCVLEAHYYLPILSINKLNN